jgi:hypothetical protein
MGCDYYISTYLEIKFTSEMCCLHINLETNRGYYDFNLDEDDPKYDEKCEEYVKQTLSNTFTPILIFENNQFLNSKLENKYKLLIEKELEQYNKHRENNFEWKDIRKIVKKESRFERD